jgi:hypothetical protein
MTITDTLTEDQARVLVALQADLARARADVTTAQKHLLGAYALLGLEQGADYTLDYETRIITKTPASLNGTPESAEAPTKEE